MFTFECGVANKVWRHSLISSKHVSLWCLFFDPHLTIKYRCLIKNYNWATLGYLITTRTISFMNLWAFCAFWEALETWNWDLRSMCWYLCVNSLRFFIFQVRWWCLLTFLHVSWGCSWGGLENKAWCALEEQGRSISHLFGIFNILPFFRSCFVSSLYHLETDLVGFW